MALTILYFTVLLLTTPATSDDGDAKTPAIIRTICSPNKTQHPEIFDINFVDALEVVSQKVAGDGFGTAASGDNISDLVYGLGQCFGYLSRIDCRLCYAQSRVKLPHCLPSTSARIYLDGCFLAYGDRNFSGDAVDNFDTSLCGLSTNESNSTKFREMASGLVQNLVSEAYGERDYYKVGNVSVFSGLEVFGMAECWRSVSRNGCKECLEKAGKSAVGCLPASDGKALNAGCYVRYSTERFYEAPLASSSSRGSSGN